ncbi:TPA: metallophosphoesterase [Candidatus Bathyarchaeota archaeon]|nr:metallophosphoesterase [Candidatus Bathyarchaeota archaeon]
MVEVGIISDTHDNIRAIERAVELFNERKVDIVIHCGDYCAPFTARFFARLKAKLLGCFGNCDGERHLLRERYEGIGAEIRGDFVELALGGRNIAVVHGAIEPIVEALARCGRYDVVCRGHSHEAGAQREGGALVINPGEACGYLSGSRTVAVIDLERLEAAIFRI